MNDMATFADKLTALGETEMELLRFLLGKPAGAILTVPTDLMLAELLAREGFVDMEEGGKVIVPQAVRDAFGAAWTDEAILRWRKRNWMYKCLEAGRFLYGVMSPGVLYKLFALRYPGATADEARELFDSTPMYYQWFTERDGWLVLNGYEEDDYYKLLMNVQRDVPFYIPTAEEVEELYDNGCLISGEYHAKLRDFIKETYGISDNDAVLKVHELYNAVNDRVRMNDAAEAFEKSGQATGTDLTFPSDEAHVRFVELLMEMSRECRVRDNRGHDFYEMTGIMASRRKGAAKVGRNEPCPCGSGFKYKNCCGRS